MEPVTHTLISTFSPPVCNTHDEEQQTPGAGRVTVCSEESCADTAGVEWRSPSGGHAQVGWSRLGLGPACPLRGREMIPPRWSLDLVPEVRLSPRLYSELVLLPRLPWKVLDGFCECGWSSYSRGWPSCSEDRPETDLKEVQ